MDAARLAFRIAATSSKWADAVQEIIRRGLAEDAAGADALIRAGEGLPVVPGTRIRTPNEAVDLVRRMLQRGYLEEAQESLDEVERWVNDRGVLPDADRVVLALRAAVSLIEQYDANSIVRPSLPVVDSF